MAIIGTFRKTENGYVGAIETLALRGEISIEAAEKRGDNGPDSRVYHVTPSFRSDIGAAWKKISRNKGNEYLSLTIDEPSLPGPIYCRLVKTGTESGYTLFWERPRPQDEQD